MPSVRTDLDQNAPEARKSKSCPLCDLAARKRLEINGYTIYECVGCEFLFLDPMPPDEIVR